MWSEIQREHTHLIHVLLHVKENKRSNVVAGGRNRVKKKFWFFFYSMGLITAYIWRPILRD